MEVCVVGTGYVGLVTGTCLAYLGHSVVCVDIDERKIEMLRSGRSPIYEPGLDQLIASGLQRGNLQFSTDISKPSPAQSGGPRSSSLRLGLRRCRAEKPICPTSKPWRNPSGARSIASGGA